MDPSKFLPYSPPNGLPQESKLATYMNHSTSTPKLNQAIANLNLESSPPAVRKVLINEFVPMNYYSPANIVIESPRSSPPTALYTNPQVHQENVGGTTYFYSTNDSLNSSGALNSSASLVGAESSIGVNIGPRAATPYGTQMYSVTPPHLVPKPIGAEPSVSENFGPYQAYQYGSYTYPTTTPARYMVPNSIGAEPSVGENFGSYQAYQYGSDSYLSTSPTRYMVPNSIGAEPSVSENFGPYQAYQYGSYTYPTTTPARYMIPNSIGAESTLGVNVSGNAATPFGSQMYSAIPPHIGSMVPKPLGAESGIGVNIGRSAASPFGIQMYSATPHMIAKPGTPDPTYQSCFGAESCMGVNIASSYGPQMYSANPPHIGQMVSKPVGAESCMGVNVGSSTISPFGSQLYSTPPPLIGPMVSKSGLTSSFYTPEVIRAEICQRNEEMFLHTDFHQYPDLPENVEMYSDLVPLEAYGPHSLASTFRASHRQSGEPFVLRRLHAYTSVPTNRMDMWKQIDHPNIVRLHEYFTTQAFGDHSLVLVYDYHPACVTLISKYLSGTTTGNPSEANGAFLDPFSSDPDAPRPYTHQKNTMLRAVASGALLPEAVLWSLLVQLTAALRAVHTAGLACRILDITKVVMIGGRVRIAWCGAADALHPNSNDITQAQQDDLTALGRLALVLACRTIHCDNLSTSMDLVSRTYSADLKNLVLYLLSNTTTRRCINDLMPMIGARFYTQVEALERRTDVFEEQFAHEMDNGRLLRILIKLGIVNERPELNMDQSWSETGNRYMLKLFRDYLFHSVTEDGRPWIDQAHLAHCLNQLDSGTNTRVELMSRDEQSVLVVTYSELKHCLEQAFDEVMQTASQDS